MTRPAAPRRTGHRKAAQSRQRFYAVVAAAIILIVGVVGYVGYQRMIPKPSADFEGSGNGVVELVEIQPGSSVSALGPELVERGIVKSNGAFQSAANANSKASSVTPGIYRLQQKMSAEAAVAALVDPEQKVEMLDIPGGATIMDVTVVGGSTRPGIFSEVAKVTCAEQSATCVTPAQLFAVAADTPAAELGVSEWAQGTVDGRKGDPKRLEGLIVPGQYVVNPQADAKAIIKDLVTRSAAQFAETNIVERADSIGLSPYELLTAASLVEREAPAGDFDKVARVILNRLAEPMRLEFDSTVNYDLPDQEVATTDEARRRETPWNTYAKDGLPATPIAAASIEAITAMENPAEGDWLFFVTVDKDGTTVFNRTFEDHMRDTQKAIDSGILDSNR